MRPRSRRRTIFVWMRTPRSRDARHVAALGCAAAAVAALVLAAPVVGAGGTDARTAAEGWRGAFEQRAQVDLGRRMIVVLAAPSLADRVAASGRLPGPKM